MPDLARSADDCALGHSRPGRSQRLSGRDRACLQGCLPDAVSAHRRLHSAAAALARSAQPAVEAERNWPPSGRDHEDHGAELMPSLARRAVSECLGTAFLLAAVVGSGIMAAKLAGGNNAIALLCNTLPTSAILVVLILIFGPLSGAHFNPAVSLAFALQGALPWR